MHAAALRTLQVVELRQTSARVRPFANTVRREVRASGPGEALAAALLVTALYLEPLLGSAPWLASLAIACLAGGALLLLRPRRIRDVPLILVAYVSVYVLAGLVSGLGGAAEIARYVVRPVAIGALTLFLVTPESRRRVVVLVVLLVIPQVVVTGAQTLSAVLEHGSEARVAVDSVTGTFGDSEASILGLVAIAVMCLGAGLAFARVIAPRHALWLAVVMTLIAIFTSTRAAIVFIPFAAAALAAAALLAARRRPPARMIAATLAVGVVAAPAVYLGTEAVYPGAFIGAFENQRSNILEESEVEREKEAQERREREGKPAEPYTGPRGVALLPGRAKQLRKAVEISGEDGARVFLLGRGFGATEVPEDAIAGQAIPKEQLTGATWAGRIIGDAGWLGFAAFVVLMAWLAWLGLRIVRRPASRLDLALGFALPGLVAVTVAGAVYATILDVRTYSAVFIVLAAAAFAAARDSAAAGSSDGPDAPADGRRARASTPLPPRQQETSAAPSATSARSS